MRRSAAITLFVASLGVVRSARGAPCPGDAALGEVAARGAEIGVARRRAFLDASFERGARSSRRWALGWGLGLTGLTAVQLALVPAAPDQMRIDLWVGAAASGIGASFRAVLRPRVLAERRRLRAAPGTCEGLHASEAALVRSARWERQGKGLWMHALSLGYNAGVGLVLALAFRRPVAGNRVAAMGAVIGEVMILTQPTPMSRTLDAYRSRRPSTWVRPLLGPGVAGLSVGGRI